MNAYLTRNGKVERLRFGESLGDGAAAEVYRVAGPHQMAAKIYHQKSEAGTYEAKIDVMIVNRPNLPDIPRGGRVCRQIAWPEGKIFDQNGSFIGFIMPEIDTSVSKSLVNLLQKASRKIENISEFYGFRVAVAANLSSVFHELHRVGHYMIDMKPQNLRFYLSSGLLAVVDTDGFSIAGPRERFPSSQVSDEYTAPEARNRKASDLGVQQDLFSLAVIIFQLLNNGVHPFQGSSKNPTHPTDIQGRVNLGLYAYGLRAHEDAQPALASIHTSFRPATRQLFDRAFAGTGNRPTALEWREHLRELLKHVVRCDRKPGEHGHFGDGCGHCESEKRQLAMTAKVLPSSRSRPPKAVPAAPSGSAQPARPSVTASPTASVPAKQPPPLQFPWLKAAGWLFALWLVVSVISCVADGVKTFLRGPQQRTTSSSSGGPQGYTVQPFSSNVVYLVSPGPGVRRVNVRSGPGSGYALVLQVAAGSELIGTGSAVGADGSTWIAVTLPSDGWSGFIAERLLRPRPDARQSGAQPSFACVADLTYVERAICDDAALAAKDREVADLYRQIQASARGSGARDTQRGWLEERDRCGGSGAIPACLHSVYDSRIQALRDWLSRPPLTEDAPAVRSPDSSGADSGETRRPSRRAAPEHRQHQNIEIAPTITCILPSGQETRVEAQQCRQMSGVIYQ